MEEKKPWEEPGFDHTDPKNIREYGSDPEFSNFFRGQEDEKKKKENQTIITNAKPQYIRNGEQKTVGPNETATISNLNLEGTRALAKQKMLEAQSMTKKSADGTTYEDRVNAFRGKEAANMAAAITEKNALQEYRNRQIQNDQRARLGGPPLPEDFIEKLIISEAGFQPFMYLVRGALLHCRCGSHDRRLNLPMDHGVYATDHPMIHCLDCLEGDMQNISAFGICSSPTIPKGKKIRLNKPILYNALGLPMTESTGTMEGYPCTPVIVGTWLATRAHNRIVDNGQKDPVGKANGEGQPAVTTLSFLVCKFGGLIEPLNSGQEYINLLFGPYGQTESGAVPN